MYLIRHLQFEQNLRDLNLYSAWPLQLTTMTIARMTITRMIVSISILAGVPPNYRCHDAGNGPTARGWSTAPNCTVSDVAGDMDPVIGLLGLGSPWLGEIACDSYKLTVESI